jgi:hypothetical protein
MGDVGIAEHTGDTKNRVETGFAIVQAVNYLASTNDIVVDDLGFFGDAYDGTSAVSAGTATALNNPAYPIRAYFTAVGNSADEHYYGVYQDSGIEATSLAATGDTGHLHLFQQSDNTTDVLGLGAQPYNLIALPNGGEVLIFLSWDDPMGGSANDYDLFLVEKTTGRVVAASNDPSAAPRTRKSSSTSSTAARAATSRSWCRTTTTPRNPDT